MSFCGKTEDYVLVLLENSKYEKVISNEKWACFLLGKETQYPFSALKSGKIKLVF